MRKRLEGLCARIYCASFCLCAVFLVLAFFHCPLIIGRLEIQVIAVFLAFGYVAELSYAFLLYTRCYCKTKPVSGEADQFAAEDQVVLQKEPRP